MSTITVTIYDPITGTPLRSTSRPSAILETEELEPDAPPPTPEPQPEGEDAA